MERIRKIATKKVHFGHALFIIICSATIPSILFLAVMFTDTPQADAAFNISLMVAGVPINCASSYDPFTGRCEACTACGVNSNCTSLSELLVRPYRQAYMSQLANSTSLCLNQKDAIRPPKGGSWRPGASCIGGVFFTPPNQHVLFTNFGCSR